ncbi:MAG: right-handed parallel beta-helix repeat-containing protein [Clostridia bacterium]|nr:right-handed parallel beta-helix repeat-containing protein [Clostridia bacterium]
MKFRKLLTVTTAITLSAVMLTSCASEPVPQGTDLAATTAATEMTTTVEDNSITLYVDAKAAPNGDGSKTEPFSEISQAQKKIRELKAATDFSADGITVVIKDGEYILKEGLNFTAEDSGTEECPITYVSENGGAILSGGVILSNSDFEPLTDEEKERLVEESAKENVVKADLTKYGVDLEAIETVNSNAMELFIDGARSTLARYPNDSFVRTATVIDVGDTHELFSDSKFDQRGVSSMAPGFVSYDVNNRGGTFTVKSDVLERINKWASFDDVYIHGYLKWSWSDSTTRIGSVNTVTGAITLSKAVTYGLSVGAPFYFLNVYEEIDSPGEFFIDKSTGTLYVYKTETFDSAEIMLSALSSDIITATDLSHVTFDGLSLCATRGNGITVSGSDIVIDNCRIYNVRGGAITANGNNITVQNCELTNLGSFGINISGGDPVTLASSGNLVHNNFIRNFGIIRRTYQSAVAVGGCGVTVSHNEISESPHQAISWSGPNHLFEYNEIYNVCLETSDCGAFYGGRNFSSYGCVIRYNYIHNIGAENTLANAIYWDDGLSGQTAYGNIITDITNNAFAIGGGRDNVVENNLIIDTMMAPISYDQRTRDSVYDPGAWFTHNAVMAEVIPTFQNEYWNEEFPIYGQLIPYTGDYTGDPDDPLLSANPANNIIRNNVGYSYFGGSRKNKISDYIPESGVVENNTLIKITRDEHDAWDAGDSSLLTDPRTLDQCPDFEILPIEKMGLK